MLHPVPARTGQEQFRKDDWAKIAAVIAAKGCFGHSVVSGGWIHAHPIFWKNCETVEPKCIHWSAVH